jgi:TatD DNase family protein
MINSHIHLDFTYISSPSKATTGAIIPATGKDNWDNVVSCCSIDNSRHFALGIHPWFIDDHQILDLHSLEVRIEELKPVAVGECGLDYARIKDRNRQRYFFDEQIALATRFDLPLIIHSVHATEDVTDLLKSHSKSRGVIHTYSGSLQQAEILLNMNFSFGFGHSLTNPHAYKLHDIVKFLPLEMILIETDDYKNPDELIQIAERIARIKKLSVEQVVEQCDLNACNLFNIS